MSDPLSSDILESQFGATELEILEQDGLSRTIITRAVDSGQVLEYSKVKFWPEGIKAFPKVHEKILAGQSMGKAFSEAKVPFTRHTRTVNKQVADPELAQKLGITSQAENGEVTVVEVSILVGTKQVPYADILETYSPAVIWPVE